MEPEPEPEAAAAALVSDAAAPEHHPSQLGEQIPFFSFPFLPRELRFRIVVDYN